jgi:hypothetical protein
VPYVEPADPCRAVQILKELTKAYTESGVGVHFAHLRPAHMSLFELVGIVEQVSHACLPRLRHYTDETGRADSLPPQFTHGNARDRIIRFRHDCNDSIPRLDYTNQQYHICCMHMSLRAPSQPWILQQRSHDYDNYKSTTVF